MIVNEVLVDVERKFDEIIKDGIETVVYISVIVISNSVSNISL